MKEKNFNIKFGSLKELHTFHSLREKKKWKEMNRIFSQILDTKPQISDLLNIIIRTTHTDFPIYLFSFPSNDTHHTYSLKYCFVNT